MSDLVAIPSCAFPGFPREPLESSARDTARWFSDIGMPDVQVVSIPDAPPCVVARDHRAGPERPTLLLYAHHDVQPPLRSELWTSPAFEPVVREGRLYGRGAADDKAGIALHAASIQAWYAAEGRLPLNVTVLVEGEEETGSNHLERFLRENLELLRADAVVIADLSNFDTGLPSLTVSLRGLVAVELELKAMERSVHSGLWGNAVPDVVGEFCRILSALGNPDGTIAVPGILDGILPPTASELADWKNLPYDRAAFAAVPGVDPGLVPEDPVDLGRKLWRTPSLSVNGIQAGNKGTTGNVLMDKAWARVGIRIVPGMDPRRVMDLLSAHLRSLVPSGYALEIREESLAPAWGTATDHPIFGHARKSLAGGYGRSAVEVGCGATIPFVESVTAALGGIPALLVGVEDPSCNAHSEDESVHLGDLLSAIRSQALLFGEVGADSLPWPTLVRAPEEADRSSRTKPGEI